MPSVAELRSRLTDAYPALARSLDLFPEDLAALARGTRQARDLRSYRRLAATALGDDLRKGLRRFAARERMRIAARELLAHPGQDVDVTARELSDLADVCCEAALGEALRWAEARFGTPLAAGGEPCPFVVVGMGKLGGRELNAGSDIDLMLFYETDDGAAGDLSLHEHFTRVAQRFVATLDDSTEDGVVWRVDLRLRPEGTRGPLVNALAAAERYYETWGRTWERAALVRARPVAGDVRFGARLLEALAPFVWRRSVDPRVVEAMTAMLARARVEAGDAERDDLKIGPGGIREVEFFTQALQLVWGGRDARVRAANTLDGLRRLRARGFVTEREETELSDAYLFLRRLEHRIQFATGLQTHALPSNRDVRTRVARSLGYSDAPALERALEQVRATVSARFASLGQAPASDDAALERLAAALDARDEAAVATAAGSTFGGWASTDLPRHLLTLARRPDGPLGSATRDREPELVSVLLQALADAADPEQAARLLATFFARLATPGVYLRALADDPHLARALASLLGASAFLGEALAGHPDLVDRVVYARGLPTAEVVRVQLDEEIAALGACRRDVDAFVGALRRAKRRVTFEVGLADLAGDLDRARRRARAHGAGRCDAGARVPLRDARARRRRPARPCPRREWASSGDASSATAPISTCSSSTRRRSATTRRPSDSPASPSACCGSSGRRTAKAPGYELDTRLRPSGSHGLLVVSVEAFARYQAEQAEAWERQALVKARACAGDPELGERVTKVARARRHTNAARPRPERMHHLRMRMERELGSERLDRTPGRYDVKVGRGGIVDIEFAAQWLQMRHGARSSRPHHGDRGGARRPRLVRLPRWARGRRAARGMALSSAPRAAPARRARHERDPARARGAGPGRARAPHGHARRPARVGPRCCCSSDTSRSRATCGRPTSGSWDWKAPARPNEPTLPSV